MAKLQVNSSDVKYTENYIETNYEYHTSHVRRHGDKIVVSRLLSFNTLKMTKTFGGRSTIITLKRLKFHNLVQWLVLEGGNATNSE